jgi:hypothetical protein
MKVGQNGKTKILKKNTVIIQVRHPTVKQVSQSQYWENIIVRLRHCKRNCFREKI